MSEARKPESTHEVAGETANIAVRCAVRSVFFQGREIQQELAKHEKPLHSTHMLLTICTEDCRGEGW